MHNSRHNTSYSILKLEIWKLPCTATWGRLLKGEWGRKLHFSPPIKWGDGRDAEWKWSFTYGWTSGLMGCFSAAAKSRDTVKKVHQQNFRPCDIPMSSGLKCKLTYVSRVARVDAAKTHGGGWHWWAGTDYRSTRYIGVRTQQSMAVSHDWMTRRNTLLSCRTAAGRRTPQLRWWWAPDIPLSWAFPPLTFPRLPLECVNSPIHGQIT